MAETTLQRVLNDAEAIVLIQATKEERAEKRTRLYPAQVEKLRELAEKVWPGIRRNYVKAHEIIFQNKGIPNIHDVDAMDAWSKKQLAKMDDAKRNECWKLRKEIAARRNA